MFEIRNRTQNRGRADYRLLGTPFVDPRSTSGRGPIVRNKANSHRTGRNRRGPAGPPKSPEPTMRNKANFRKSLQWRAHTSRETPDGVTTNAVSDLSCETKPISLHWRERARASKVGTPLSQSVRNKANSTRATWRTSALWKKAYDELGAQKICAKRSQFPGAGTAGPRGHDSILPGFHCCARRTNKANGEGYRAKQSQSGRRPVVQTKPISARQTDPMDLESATVCRPHPRHRDRENSLASNATRG